MFSLTVFIVLLGSAAHGAEDLPVLGVIGGVPTAPGIFPFQVSIEVLGKHHCGGTIISNNTIITAAHCLYRIPPDIITILAGTTNRLSGGVRFPLASYRLHPLYDGSHPPPYDAALITVQGTYNFDNILGPADLPDENEVFYKDTLATVSGWGREYQSGKSITDLRFALIPLWSHEHCKKFSKRLPESDLCAGELTGARNSCPGDSGGPLTIGKKLIGITSYGFGCGAVYYPAAYTNVAKVRGWIRKYAKI